MEQEPVDDVTVLLNLNKYILCFARSDYSLKILNLFAYFAYLLILLIYLISYCNFFEFFSAQKQWSSCRANLLLTAQNPKPASGFLDFLEISYKLKYLIFMEAFKHTQCFSIFSDDSDRVAL